MTKASKVFIFLLVKSDVLPQLFVMSLRLRAQLGGFLFGRRVAQKIPSADLRSRQILQQIWTAQRRMKLDVKMEPSMIAAVGRRLVQRHDVGERHSPQVVELRQKTFERFGEILQLRPAERRNTLMRSLRRDEHFVGVTREVRQ